MFVTLIALGVCVALLASSARAKASSWSAPTRIDGAPTTAVSCPSESFCMAVDTNGRALTYDDGSWGAPVTVINPENENGFVGDFHSVSCTSASFCAAVDAAGDAVTYNGASWSTPVKIDPNEYLYAVSCASTSFCIAMDVSGNEMTYNGSSWSIPASIDGIFGTRFWAISCQSASFCMAMGDTYFGAYEAQAFTYNGGSWSTPTNIDASNIVDIYSVSCPTISFCAAVDENGNALIYNGTWSAPTSIDGTNQMLSVSCPSSSFCIALDSIGNAMTYNGSTWNTPTSIDNSVRGTESVSCASSSFCVAVDSDGYAMTYSEPPLGNGPLGNGDSGGGGTSSGSGSPTGGSSSGPPSSAPQDTVTLGPSVETVRPGGEVSLAAQVRSSSGVPVQGIKVSFLVTNGPDAGTSESNGPATNASGYTYFNYDTLGAGTDTVIADAVSVSAPQSNGVQVRVSRSNPLQAVGLLTVKDRSGRQHSCTASVIASSNQSTILTAAHCAWGEGDYYSDFAFAPGFEGDVARCPRACKEPFGVWIGVRAYVDRRWMRSTDHAYDFAFIVMKTKAGTPIARAVGGGLSLGFQSDPRQRWTTYGYPGTPSLRNCSAGKATTTSVGSGPENFSMPCNMNGDWHSTDGGASGGPWLTRRYEIGAVNSTGTDCSIFPIPCTKELRGAQLQGAAQGLWATATTNYSTFTP